MYRQLAPAPGFSSVVACHRCFECARFIHSLKKPHAFFVFLLIRAVKFGTQRHPFSYKTSKHCLPFGGIITAVRIENSKSNRINLNTRNILP